MRKKRGKSDIKKEKGERKVRFLFIYLYLLQVKNTIFEEESSFAPYFSMLLVVV